MKDEQQNADWAQCTRTDIRVPNIEQDLNFVISELLKMVPLYYRDVGREDEDEEEDVVGREKLEKLLPSILIAFPANSMKWGRGCAADGTGEGVGAETGMGTGTGTGTGTATVMRTRTDVGRDGCGERDGAGMMGGQGDRDRVKERGGVDASRKPWLLTGGSVRSPFRSPPFYRPPPASPGAAWCLYLIKDHVRSPATVA